VEIDIFAKLNNRLECIVIMGEIAFSKICQDFYCILVDRSHHTDLAIALLDVFLIDTNCVNPYDQGTLLVSYSSHCRFQIFCCLEVLRTDLDSRCVGCISPDVGQGFIMRSFVEGYDIEFAVDGV